MVERALDPEERVRVAAVRVYADLAAHHPARLTGEGVAALTGRLRDTRPGVRREAARGVAEVFRGAVAARAAAAQGGCGARGLCVWGGGGGGRLLLG